MFKLAAPWALLLLPLPWLIWRFVSPRLKTKQQEALKVPFFDMLSQMLHKNPSHPQRFPLPLWLILAWVCLVAALTGPRWIGDPIPLKREGHNIMLALDISGSMALDDMVLNGHTSSRLEVVKQAAETFVRQRASDKIGLILFGTQAYLLTPLTYDKQHILLRLEDASVGLAGQATAIGDPIGLAVKHLKNTPQQGRILILLTDGVNNAGVLSPQKAAELAKQEGIKIYTIGLGAQTHPLHPLFPMMKTADLDEKTLKEIAKMTHGQYFRATNQASLHHIYNAINQIEMIDQDEGEIRPQKEYYPWPLALALCLLFIGLLK